MIDPKTKKQLIQNSLLIFLVFACVFSLLGVFVYQTVSSNIFRAVDQQLGSPSLYSATAVFSANDLTGTNPLLMELNDQALDTLPQSFEVMDSLIPDTPVDTDEATPAEATLLLSMSISGEAVTKSLENYPQMIMLLRDSEGALEGTTGLYSMYPQVLQTIPFDSSRLNKAYTLEHEGSTYRVVNYLMGSAADSDASSIAASGATIERNDILPYSSDDMSSTGLVADAFYMQAVLNVDSEMAILKQFTQTLVFGLVLALVVCAGASYVLSRKTVRPISRAWQQQSEFIQNASHEIRTPLTIIHTTQELLLESPRDTIADHFEDINLTLEETSRLKRMAHDLLALTSGESSRKDSSAQEYSLDDVVSKASMAYREQARKQNKYFEVELRSKWTGAFNEEQIRRLMTILVDNAFKYTQEDDRISVRTQVSKGQAQIIVTDTGIGIDDESIEHVFERFYRAENAREYTKEGAGLGLSLAQSIVESQGGSIVINHNAPKGVQIVVTLA